MKIGQTAVVRWVSKLVAKEPARVEKRSGAGLRTLDAEQLRRVAGGTGETAQSPNKGW
jgi:hypothetical protein